MIEAFPNALVSLDTLLFTNKEVVGHVDEVLGSIYAPSYSVLSDEYIKYTIQLAPPSRPNSKIKRCFAPIKCRKSSRRIFRR